jgi:hypothetical protein
MVRKYKPVFTDESIHGGFQIFLIPYIINTNIKMPLKIADHLEINDIIVGVNSPNRTVNYESKKIKQKNAAIKMNESLAKDKQIAIPVVKMMFHSFGVIVQLPESKNKVNIAVFTSGTLKVTSTNIDDHDSIAAAHLFCSEVIRIAKKNGFFLNSIDNTADLDTKNNNVYYKSAYEVIDTFIASKKTNQPTWEYDLKSESDCTLIKQEIKDVIKKCNISGVHYDGEKQSLQGMLGCIETTRKFAEGIIFGIFPAMVKGQSLLKYKINCKNVYNMLKDKYNLIYHPYDKTNVKFIFEITKKYSQKVVVNPTGMITFLTKTREEINELFINIIKIFETHDFSLNDNKGISLFDSSDSE